MCSVLKLVIETINPISNAFTLVIIQKSRGLFLIDVYNAATGSRPACSPLERTQVQGTYNLPDPRNKDYFSHSLCHHICFDSCLVTAL